MVEELSTSAKTVGSTNQPLSSPAGRPPPVVSRAPSPRALGDVALDPVALAGRRHRADLRRRVECVADLQRRRRTPVSGVDDLLVARGRGEHPGAEEAGLPVVEQRGSEEALRFGRRSASSSTIAADLPPSSSVTGRSRRPQVSAICRPAAVDPVKATLSIPGWLNEVRADLAAARHDVDHAGRECRLPRPPRRASGRRAPSPGDGLRTIVQPSGHRRARA